MVTEIRQLAVCEEPDLKARALYLTVPHRQFLVRVSDPYGKAMCGLESLAGWTTYSIRQRGAFAASQFTRYQNL